MGWIYALQNGDPMKVKIGYAGEVKRRRKDLQTGSPDLLKDLFPPIKGTKKREHLLHERYKPYNIRGEWFWLPEIRNDLEKVFSKGVREILPLEAHTVGETIGDVARTMIHINKAVVMMAYYLQRLEAHRVLGTTVIDKPSPTIEKMLDMFDKSGGVKPILIFMSELLLRRANAISERDLWKPINSIPN